MCHFSLGSCILQHHLNHETVGIVSFPCFLFIFFFNVKLELCQQPPSKSGKATGSSNSNREKKLRKSCIISCKAQVMGTEIQTSCSLGFSYLCMRGPTTTMVWGTELLLKFRHAFKSTTISMQIIIYIDGLRILGWGGIELPIQIVRPSACNFPCKALRKLPGTKASC